jgi:hypothetical protein
MPQLKSIDGFNLWDSAIQIINSGGVTTSLILPGSSDLMGGEAYAIKHIIPPSNLTTDMLINSGLMFDETWRWAKMVKYLIYGEAFGENQKNRRNLHQLPVTRMGEAWVIRERFEKVIRIKEKQDDWCKLANAIKKSFFKAPSKQINSRYPTSLADDLLVALLRKKARLNIHCYTVLLF